MNYLASDQAKRAVLGVGLGLLIFGGSSTQLIGCYEPPGPRDPEDRDGVNIVKSPADSAVAGPGGGVGGGGAGGAAASGVTTGAPCAVANDCFDIDICTIDACTNMECVSRFAADDGDLCTTDTCDSLTGDITNVPISGVSDGSICTVDRCDPSSGMINPPKLVVFSEDFSDNSAGWVPGAEWAIGTANASLGGLAGGNDPAMDFSLSSDNGIAGTVLGGLVANTAHGFSYLTSPAIVMPTLAAGEFATLRFRRYLNSDAPAVMSSVVEVYHGTTSYPLYANNGQVIDSPPNGVGWFEVRIDITLAVNNAAGAPIRLRFGFDHRVTGTASIGGWNLDDVSVEITPYPMDGNICTTDDCDAGTNSPIHNPVSPCP